MGQTNKKCGGICCAGSDSPESLRLRSGNDFVFVYAGDLKLYKNIFECPGKEPGEVASGVCQRAELRKESRETHASCRHRGRQSVNAM